MQLFLSGADAATPITHFGSEHARLARGVRTDGGATMGCLHLGTDGRLGLFPAPSAQFLMVLAGAGGVERGDGRCVPIGADQAASWLAWEKHYRNGHRPYRRDLGRRRAGPGTLHVSVHASGPRMKRFSVLGRLPRWDATGGCSPAPAQERAHP